jgi:hypothetical protein
MIAFLGVMHFVLLKGSPQRKLSEENQPGEAVLFDRSHPALRVGIQVGTLGWQPDWCHIPRFDDLIKRQAELALSVMQQIPAIPQKASSLQGHGPGHLFHPRLIWVRSHSCQANLATLQMSEEEVFLPSFDFLQLWVQWVTSAETFTRLVAMQA